MSVDTYTSIFQTHSPTNPDGKTKADLHKSNKYYHINLKKNRKVYITGQHAK